MIHLRDVATQFTRNATYLIDVGWGQLESLIAQWSSEQEVDLDPDFQRAHVWTTEQQRRFVEYVLRGGAASREIYFNCSSWDRGYDTPLYLVDGKQRLTAVLAFLRGDLPAFGHYYIEYHPSGFGIASVSFRFYVNDLPTRADMLQWYLDLNDGGTQHTSAELQKVRNMLAEEDG